MTLKVGDRVIMIDKGFIQGDFVGTVSEITVAASYPVRVEFETWSHSFKYDELELVEPVEPMPIEADTEGDRLRDFFFGVPKKHNGKCKRCGCEGRIHLSAFICDLCDEVF